MNPFEIGKPCIIISGREILFEGYRMALKRDKYDIEVQNDDSIKRNRIFFDFMQLTCNGLDRLYLHEKSPLIDTIIEIQSRKQSAAEVEILNRKNDINKKRKVHPSLLQKKDVL